MAEQSAHEPTMEEILASIRRIISEDDAPEDAKAEPEVEFDEPEAEAEIAAEPEPVEDEAEAEIEPVAEFDSEDDVLELTETYEAPESIEIGDLEAYTPSYAPEPVAAAPQPAPVAAKPSAGLVSEHTESRAASTFSSLTSSLLVPSTDRTLEDVTRDLLRPLLQAWLDENLPAIVEEQVRSEVERIARQSRR